MMSVLVSFLTILGEVDSLAGAQAKVDAMITRAKERAAKAKRPGGAHRN
jgi:hypothetical protein